LAVVVDLLDVDRNRCIVWRPAHRLGDDLSHPPSGEGDVLGGQDRERHATPPA
jgi:hypothetical protein